MAKREYGKDREIIVTFRVSPQVKAWIREESRRDGVGISEFCRDALKREYVRRRVET